MIRTRLIRVDDAPVLARLLVVNREFMAPWSPIRDEIYYTDDGQRALIRELLERHERGETLPHVVISAKPDGVPGEVIGAITLSGIVRGPFQSGNLGYWIDAAHNGRGIATAATGEIVRIAFDKLGLHRIQAGTLVHNGASQKVLQRNGFERFGLAPNYLKIAGRWQDHVLFQVVAPAG
ncbi:MAG: GNAT family N-acetyltransferase [Acidothermaceae bacterium]